MILAFLRSKLLGFDPIQLQKDIENAAAKASLALSVADHNRTVADKNIATVQIRANGLQSRLDNMEAALGGKATAADVSSLHVRLDMLEQANADPVVPAGSMMVNGRVMDLSGDIPTIPAEKTGEPNLRERLATMKMEPVELDGMVTTAGLSTVESKVTKARKPRAPKGGGK